MADIYYVPSGPKNLSSVNEFRGIIWNQVADYWIEILSSGTVIATTPLMTMGCCCDEEDVIIHFRNYAGAVDQASFQKPTISHETKSSLSKKSNVYPLIKQDFSWNRFNVNANDTYEAVNTCLKETDADWIQELFDTSIAFVQWKGVQGQSDDYLPIIILDGTFEKQSSDFGATGSKTTIKFKLSNDFIIQRN